MVAFHATTAESNRGLRTIRQEQMPETKTDALPLQRSLQQALGLVVGDFVAVGRPVAEGVLSGLLGVVANGGPVAFSQGQLGQ